MKIFNEILLYTGGTVIAVGLIFLLAIIFQTQ
jgi:hypothetical protein